MKTGKTKIAGTLVSALMSLGSAGCLAAMPLPGMGAASPGSPAAEPADGVYFRHQPYQRPAQMPCATAELTTSGGAPLPVYRWRGDRWTEGEEGAAFAVRLTNRCDGRMLAVVSVDGVNAVTGETAAMSQGGYVLSPGESYLVRGWRKSLSQSAEFFFAKPGSSYAAATGRPANVGVVGAAFFREKVRYEPPPQILTERSPAGYDKARDGAAKDEMRSESMSGGVSKKAAMPAAAPSLGAGHGRRIDDNVGTTTFERDGAAGITWTTRYESRAGLEALGVIPVRRTAPSAFPGERGFVPDP